MELWRDLLTWAGTATAVTGTVLAFRETDLKRMLAYTTVTALGTLTMLIGIAPELSITAAVTFLIVHAFYKAALFHGRGHHRSRDRHARRELARRLAQGHADHGRGRRAGGVLHGGAARFRRLVAKELIYEAKLELGPTASVLIAAGFL